jgi:hypothetical protein
LTHVIEDVVSSGCTASEALDKVCQSAEGIAAESISYKSANTAPTYAEPLERPCNARVRGGFRGATENVPRLLSYRCTRPKIARWLLLFD